MVDSNSTGLGNEHNYFKNIDSEFKEEVVKEFIPNATSKTIKKTIEEIDSIILREEFAPRNETQLITEFSKKFGVQGSDMAHKLWDKKIEEENNIVDIFGEENKSNLYYDKLNEVQLDEFLNKYIYTLENVSATKINTEDKSLIKEGVMLIGKDKSKSPLEVKIENFFNLADNINSSFPLEEELKTLSFYINTTPLDRILKFPSPQGYETQKDIIEGEIMEKENSLEKESKNILSDYIRNNQTVFKKAGLGTLLLGIGLSTALIVYKNKENIENGAQEVSKYVSINIGEISDSAGIAYGDFKAGIGELIASIEMPDIQLPDLTLSRDVENDESKTISYQVNPGDKINVETGEITIAEESVAQREPLVEKQEKLNKVTKYVEIKPISEKPIVQKIEKEPEYEIKPYVPPKVDMGPIETPVWADKSEHVVVDKGFPTPPPRPVEPTLEEKIDKYCSTARSALSKPENIVKDYCNYDNKIFLYFTCVDSNTCNFGQVAKGNNVPFNEIFTLKEATQYAKELSGDNNYKAFHGLMKQF